MLPGLRLIVVSFLCSFVAVFAGLRVVASLNNIHENLPIVAAHAAQGTQVSPTSQAAAIEPRSTPLAVPVLYDLRFVSSTIAPQLVSAAPQTIEQLLPKPIPLIEQTFREFVPAEPATEPAPEATAAVDRQRALPPEPPPVEPAKPAAAAAAAAEPPQAPVSVPSEPLALSLQPISEPSAPVESKITMIAPEAESPTEIEAPKPAQTKAALRAAAKAARKKRARVARQLAPANQYNSQAGQAGPGRSN